MRLVLNQFFKFDLQLLKRLVVEISDFEELNKWQLNILVNYLICQWFERAVDNAFGFQNRSGSVGDIRVGFRHVAEFTTNPMAHCDANRFGRSTNRCFPIMFDDVYKTNNASSLACRVAPDRGT